VLTIGHHLLECNDDLSILSTPADHDVRGGGDAGQDLPHNEMVEDTSGNIVYQLLIVLLN
jgi:hypothetical protein